MSGHVLPPVSNGNPIEQALIRRWWRESEGARGRLVWEYFLEGRFVDAVWFPDDPGTGLESNGKEAPTKFPLNGAEVVLCEAKRHLSPELVGQALVYAFFAMRAGARVRGAILFAEVADKHMSDAARALGLSAVVGDGLLEPPGAPLRIARITD